MVGQLDQSDYKHAMLKLYYTFNILFVLVIILASVVLEVVMSGCGYKNKSWLLTYL